MDKSSLTHINVYLFRGENGYLLVDSGLNTDASFATLHNYLIKNDLGFGDISQIFITHTHPDHYGQAGRIAELSGATIAMHPLEQAIIEPRYLHMEELLHKTGLMLTANGLNHDDMVRLRDATMGLETHVVMAQPQRLLRETETITTGEFTFRVIWTPGHSPGHCCLYDEEHKILVAGDHVLPRITPNISVNPLSIENPLGRYISSLRELRVLDVDIVLPGHDQPFDNLKERIDTIINHHDWRNAEIRASMNHEPVTAAETAGQIQWGTKARFNDLPAFHQRMAIFETMAHMDIMAADRKLDRFSRGGIIYYRQT